MSDKVKIIVADDEDLFRKGICYLLEDNGFEIIFEASDGIQLVQYLRSNANHPDLILMDIKMPGLNGIEATKEISESFPEIRIIALSSYITATFIANTIRVGACSYIPKNASPQEMIETIENVLKSGYYYNNFMRQHISQEKVKAAQKTKNVFNDTLLTNREYEVLKLICNQKSTSEIAELLHLSPRTVEGHRNNLLIKTESKNIAGLVVYAIRYDLISINDTLDF